ncbi:MAG: hypothetical protein IPN14_11865 [Bacteroidetes bacterium]|nr:hypothetical protein [Bacteroidota bacterium]
MIISREILIVELNNGQRGVASFKAYKEYGEVSSEQYSITNEEPFKSLDELSKVDYLNKQIIIYGSGGVCANGHYIYKLQVAKNEYDDNKFVLENIIEERTDDKSNGCYELKYKVINQTKQLISKRKM